MTCELSHVLSLSHPSLKWLSLSCYSLPEGLSSDASSNLCVTNLLTRVMPVPNAT